MHINAVAYRGQEGAAESPELELTGSYEQPNLTLEVWAISPSPTSTHLEGTWYAIVWVVNRGIEIRDTGQIKLYPGTD